MKFKKVLNNGDIVISSSHNGGFIVSVGCCTLVYSNADDLTTDLKDYLANPEDFEKGCTNAIQQVAGLHQHFHKITNYKE